jgi:hypothetical protein
MNKKAIIIDQDINTKKDRIAYGLRQIFIVFTGTIAIISMIICAGFLIRIYFDQYTMEKIFVMTEGYIYGLVFVVIVSLLWTIQALVWYYKNQYQW